MPDLFTTPPGAVVPYTSELKRISEMPRRTWTELEMDDLAREMTDALRTPYGSMTLRPLQAVALYEIGTEGGLFGVLRCGAGKTLVSLLAPVVAFAERPLLVVPAKLIDKTERDRRELSEHWKLPGFLRIMSYEWLGRAQAADALEEFLPDIVVLDETHRVSNLRAAVTRRFRRLQAEHPETMFIPMSGTVTKRSLHDFAHLLRWTFGPDKMPVPRVYQDLEFWADALDERKGQLRRADPGALAVLCNEEEKKTWRSEPRRAARSAFRRRLVETAGIVATYETPIDATLIVNGVEPSVSPKVDEAFDTLRKDWALPDGATIADGLGIFQHARELSLGFWYRWDPPAPKDWLEARKTWHAFVRRVLKHSRNLDSELQVRRAHPTEPALLAWKAIQPTFEPNTVPVWLDDSVLEYCAKWAEENKGIVWTEHTVVGERLHRDYGIPYYGRRGVFLGGSQPIEDHPPGTPLVASIQSNSEGRNLQAWSANLITSAPANGKQWEQLVSRTHRDGQEADEVTFDLITLCAEHVGAFWQAVSDSRYVQDSTGSPQKLLLSTVNVLTPDDVAGRAGARWQK